MANRLLTELVLKDNNFGTGIQSAKQKLDSFNGTGNGVKATLGLLGKSFGVNVSALTKLGTVAGVAGVAIKGFNEMMKRSDSITDDYGRTMSSINSIVDHFWKSINTGSFNAFITGLEDIVSNAREAYNALDELSTHMAFHDKKTAEFAKRRAEYTKNIRAGINVEANKKALKALEVEELKYYKKTAQLKKEAGYRELVELTGSRAGSGWLTPYLSLGAEGKANALKEALRLENIMKSMKYRQAKQQGKIGTMSEMLGMDFTLADKKIAALKKYSDLTDKELAQVNGYFADAYKAEETYYLKSTKDLRQLNKKTGGKTTSSSGKSTIKDTKINVELDIDFDDKYFNNRVKEMAKKISQTQPIQLPADFALNLNYNDPNFQNRLSSLKGMINEQLNKKEVAIKFSNIEGAEQAENKLQSFIDLYNKLIDLSGLDVSLKLHVDETGLNVLNNTAKKQLEITDKYMQGWSGISSIGNQTAATISSIGSALKTMNSEDATATEQWAAGFQLISDVASTTATMIQTIQGVVLAFAEANAAASAKNAASAQQETAANVGKAISATAGAMGEAAASGAGLPFPANIVAIATGVAAVTAVLASIFSIIGSFANGGIIGGNSYSGDRLYARVNSGEMVLNSSQQAKLWNLINHPDNFIGSTTNGGKVEFEIKGTQLVGVQRNYYKKQSRL